MGTTDLGPWALLALAVGLAMDAFAVAVATGLVVSPITPRHVFRLSFHFGLFQFLMPILGWFVGREVAAWAADFDHWIAFGLLTYVGGKMLVEGFMAEEDRPRDDPTRGWRLVSLSVATSIDALAVGLTMALLGVSVWGPAVVIGLVAAALTAAGVGLGSRVGPRWGTWAEVVGGCVLLAIGTRILWLHLFATGISP